MVANSIFNIYLKCFNVVAEKRIKAKDIAEICIHTHLVSVLTTGVLMWSYAILAWLTIAHPLPGIVGVITSIIHLCSPLLFRTSNNHFFHTNIFIGAGMVHQLTFAYFTGGFDSHILIWLGILPMLAGVIVGRRGAILWALITTVCILIFLILKLNGFVFPNLISPHGHTIAQGLILFGWIFISSIVIWAHVVLVEKK